MTFKILSLKSSTYFQRVTLLIWTSQSGAGTFAFEFSWDFQWNQWTEVVELWHFLSIFSQSLNDYHSSAHIWSSDFTANKHTNTKRPLWKTLKDHTCSKGGFFSESEMKFFQISKSQKKIFQKTILSLGKI